MSQDLSVSVVIPTYKREAGVIRDAIQSLLDGTRVPNEILVVDQTPGDAGRLSEIENLGRCVRLKHITEVGLPNARNVGWREAGGEIVIYCDDDVVVDSKFVESHVRNYRDPTIGGVGGRVEQHDLPDVPADADVGTFRFWDGGFDGNYGAKRRQDIHSTFGCNMSFRREVLEETGGFVKTYGGTAHLEESELCLKIRHAGYRIVFDPDAGLTHLHITSGGCRTREMSQWAYWYGHNYLFLFLRHFNWQFLPLFLAERLLKAIHFGLEAGDLYATTGCLQGLMEGANCYFRQKEASTDGRPEAGGYETQFLFSEGARCRHEKRRLREP